MDQYLAITNDLLSKLETVYLVKDVDTCMYVIPCCVYFQTIVELLLEKECVHSIYSDGLLPSLLLPAIIPTVPTFLLPSLLSMPPLLTVTLTNHFYIFWESLIFCIFSM